MQPLLLTRSVLKIIACALLTILAYILLYSGSIFFWGVFLPVTFRIVKIDFRGTAAACAGLMQAFLGVGALFAALKLGRSAPLPPRFERRLMMLFGLLFPGAAQIYAGRWTCGMIFMFGPLYAFFVGLGLLCLAGIFAPSINSLIAGFGGFWRLWIAVSLLIWIGSLVEASFWASLQSSNLDATRWPRWKGVVVTLGAGIFIHLFVLMTAAILIGVMGEEGLKFKKVMGWRDVSIGSPQSRPIPSSC